MVVDALARASGEKYTSFDVVGAGPRVVAGIIEYAGFSADLYSYEKVMAGEVDLRDYEAVFVSAMSSDLGAVAKIIGKAPRDAAIAVGGPIGFDFYDILKRFGEKISLVFVGEAELSLPEVLRYTSFPEILPEELLEIRGLAFIHSGKIYFTGYPPLTPRSMLDRIKPFTTIRQAYQNYVVNRYYVEVVRGCSNFYRPIIHRKCIKCDLCRSSDYLKRLWCPRGIPPGCGFCSVPFLFGYPRSRSVPAIAREVQGLVENGARRIVLSGPDFLDYMREKLVEHGILTDPCSPPPNYDAIEELLSRITDVARSVGEPVYFFVENIKACLVDEKVAEIMGRYLRGTPVHIGLETGSYYFNKLIGKPISPRDVIRASRLFRKYGLRPYVYLMYGLPGMDSSVYNDTIRIIDKLWEAGVEKITLYRFTPLTGTAFQDEKPVIKPFARYIQRLKKRVDYYNMRSKKRLLGRIIKVYTVNNAGKLYGYPVLHGPVVFLGKSRLPDNCLAEVRITRIYPRHVSGKILRVLKCY